MDAVKAVYTPEEAVLPYEDVIKLVEERSYYTISVSAQTCKACGLCAEKCPMDVLTLCLIPRDNPSEPPETPGDWVKSFFKDKKTGAKYKKKKMGPDQV